MSRSNRINPGDHPHCDPQPNLEQGRKMLMGARDVAMSIVVSDELLTTARMTEAEMRQEIVVILFQK
jgi:hypothetical protein